MPTLVGELTTLIRGSSTSARYSVVPSSEPLSQTRISLVCADVRTITFSTHCLNSGSRACVRTTIAIDTTRPYLYLGTDGASAVPRGIEESLDHGHRSRDLAVAA